MAVVILYNTEVEHVVYLVRRNEVLEFENITFLIHKSFR